MDKNTRKTMHSSKNEHWGTPEEVLTPVRQVGKIILDPCSNKQSIVLAENNICLPQDGLAEDWYKYNGLVYVNPPYGRKIFSWMVKCQQESCFGAEIIALVPSRTDTKWFQGTIGRKNGADAVCFWKGRIKFLGAPHPAPFPSVVAYWGPRVDKFKKVFGPKGWVVTQ